MPSGHFIKKHNLNHLLDNFKGTYINVEFTEDTVDRIMSFIDKNEIPNSVDREDIHSTLLISDKKLLHVKPKPAHWDGIPVELKKVMTRMGHQALVIHYCCPEQDLRHEELLKLHHATHTYPDYFIHITLSYNCDDLDLSTLKGFDEIGLLTINQENVSGEHAYEWKESSKKEISKPSNSEQSRQTLKTLKFSTC